MQHFANTKRLLTRSVKTRPLNCVKCSRKSLKTWRVSVFLSSIVSSNATDGASSNCTNRVKEQRFQYVQVSVHPDTFSVDYCIVDFKWHGVVCSLKQECIYRILQFTVQHTVGWSFWLTYKTISIPPVFQRPRKDQMNVFSWMMLGSIWPKRGGENEKRWSASGPLSPSLARVVAISRYVLPSSNHGVLHHHATLGPYNTQRLLTFLSDRWEVAFRAWAAGSWAGVPSSLCHCAGQRFHRTIPVREWFSIHRGEVLSPDAARGHDAVAESP